MPYKKSVEDKLSANKELIVNWYTLDFLGFKEIANKLGLQDNTIRNFLKKLGIDLRKGSYSKLLKYKEEIIQKHLDGKNTVELSKEFNCNEQTIANFLYKYNNGLIHRRYRKYNINQNYFKKIDTWQKGYFLGWIFTDGTVPNSGIHINLHNKDRHVLELFSSWLNLEKDITYQPKRNHVLFHVSSINLVKDLRNIGLQKNKTYNLPHFYSDNVDVMRGFILGLSDGDGCFTYNKNKSNLKWYLCGACESFLDHISNYLLQTLHIKTYKSSTTYTNKNNNVSINYRISIHRREDILTLLDYLYIGIPKIYLERKLNKCIEFFNAKGIQVNY